MPPKPLLISLKTLGFVRYDEGMFAGNEHGTWWIKDDDEFAYQQACGPRQIFPSFASAAAYLLHLNGWAPVPNTRSHSVLGDLSKWRKRGQQYACIGSSGIHVYDSLAGAGAAGDANN